MMTTTTMTARKPLHTITPSEAWDTYVGDQSVSEFLANGGDPREYAAMSPTCEGLSERERALLSVLLRAKIFGEAAAGRRKVSTGHRVIVADDRSIGEVIQISDDGESILIRWGEDHPGMWERIEDHGIRLFASQELAEKAQAEDDERAGLEALPRGEGPDDDGDYYYYDDAMQQWYWATPEEVQDLGRRVRQGERDAYSFWCSSNTPHILVREDD